MPTKSQPQWRVTLAEVARAAGLSQTTVSLALNRRPEDCHLSAATRQKAIEAAQKLGYRPNWRARALAKRQTFTVGMVYARSAPFMTAVNESIATALAETLHASGYHQLLVPLLGEPDGWRDIIRPDRLDGCLVLHPMPVEVGQIFEQTKIPMVMINLLSDLPVPQVLADDHGGMALLMAHLLQLGHRDIALMFRGRHPHYSADHRREAYEQAMREAGLQGHSRILNDPTADPFLDGFAAGRYRPTAVICQEHVMAIDLLHQCLQRGIRVPEDLSVASFNDVYPTAVVHPPLTSVALPGEAIGRRAAEVLIDLIAHHKKTTAEGGAAAAASREWLPEQLVVRQSTAPPRQSD